MLENAKQILYPSLGVIERVDEIGDPQTIKYAYVDSDNNVSVVYTDDAEESLSTKQGSIEPYTYGFVTFSTADGGEYVIRPLEDRDGEWISSYKMSLPEDALSDLLVKPEELPPMPYLDNEQEKLIAFKSPDDDSIFGILYLNEAGAYIRINQTWIALSPKDTSFEGAVPFNVKADSAQDFIDMYDKAPVNYEEVSKYLEPVK